MAKTERMTTIGGIRLLLGYAASRGVDVGALCASLGIDPAEFDSPLRMIPFTLTRRVWLAVIDALPNENVGVGAGAFARVEQIGQAGLLFSQARNGLELLQLGVDAGPLTDTALVEDPITLLQRAGQVEVRLPAVQSAGIPERVEAAFVSMLGGLQRLGPPGLKPTEVRAAYAYSPKRAIAEQYYGCKIRWNAEGNAMCFQRSALLTPFAGANPQAGDELRALVAKVVEKRGALSFPDRVRQLLQHQLHRGDATQHAIADALGMSGRSLQRKLAASGLSFAQLREKVVEHCAVQLLRDDAYTIAEIALRLGYSEPRSFARLWKRLTGESPGRYRARMRDAG